MTDLGIYTLNFIFISEARWGQRISPELGIKSELVAAGYFFLGNTSQNLRVSSPAPVIRVYPSGLIAR